MHDLRSDNRESSVVVLVRENQLERLEWEMEIVNARDEDLFKDLNVVGGRGLGTSSSFDEISSKTVSFVFSFYPKGVAGDDFCGNFVGDVVPLVERHGTSGVTE